MKMSPHVELVPSLVADQTENVLSWDLEVSGHSRGDFGVAFAEWIHISAVKG